MLKLDLKKEPYWLELQAEVRLKVKPLTSAIMHLAQAQAVRAMLARHAVIAWDNVVVPGTETPAELTPDNVGELMDVWFINQEFGKKYMRQMDLLEAEGNGSRPARNGTSAAGRATATTARRKTSPAAEAKPAP